MADSHVVSALKAKRAELAGVVLETEGLFGRQRAQLASLDATLALFAPDIDPAEILPRKRYKRSPHYANGELARFAADYLRTANAPVTAARIADAFIQNRAVLIHDSAIRDKIAKRIGEILRKMRLSGLVVRHGTSRDSTWQVTRFP